MSENVYWPYDFVRDQRYGASDDDHFQNGNDKRKQGEQGHKDDARDANPPMNDAYCMPNDYQWWIPANGIRKDVIAADIQRYLGPSAVVRPGVGRDENRGRNGYWYSAYRTFSPSMIQDLKEDSTRFELLNDHGAYQDSVIHRSRQYWGPRASPPGHDPPFLEYGHVLPSYGQGNHTQSYEPSQSRIYPKGQAQYMWSPSATDTYSDQQSVSTPTAPPAYYIASDGRYYPTSSMPT